MRDFHFPGRSPVYSSNAIVATSHPLAANEALSVLKDGGNAVDAAIAGAVLLGVCEPHMTGIGGDMFALVQTRPDSEIVAINASGRAPAAIDPEMLRADGLTEIVPGHHASITIPGAVDGLLRLSERFGRVGIERSLAPAIHYFDEGVPIAPRVSSDTAKPPETLNVAARNIFVPNGEPLKTGDILRLPGQAEVLRRIAREGREAFYSGEVLDDMLAALEKVGGVHTAEDFAKTEATWSAPIHGPYRQRTLFEHPPNGQGAVAILLAGILAEFDMASLDPTGLDRFHIQAEATKLAYDARNRLLADPDYMTGLDRFLDPELAKSLAGYIDPNRAIQDIARTTEAVHKDTVLITVVDRDGMSVSLIYSLFANHGAGVATDKFGIVFHNRGSGFNLTLGHPNEIGPGKRPMHTIIPAMSGMDGKTDIVFGVMGGQYQACGHAHFLGNLVDHGMDLQEAIDAPRAFADPKSGSLNLERSISDEVRAGLAARGHNIGEPPTAIGGAQAIQMDHRRGILIGASDPRKDGIAIGY